MKKQLGFTLIELMMVVMIAAVLAAVAVPTYTAYIARGKIAQVTGALSEAKVRMEQSFNSVRTYASAPGGLECAGDLFVPLFSDTAFSVAVSACSDTTFTITATGLSGKGMSGYTYTINQSGDKTSTTPAATTPQNCWLQSKDHTSC